MGVYRLCNLLGVSQSRFYKRAGVQLALEQQKLVAAIEAIVLAFPGYGYRRVTAQLKREGFRINHKRVLSLMRQESLLCRLRRRWCQTTDSKHGLGVYPNLLKERTIERIDQAYVADITYIRLPEGFCFLSAILDAFSRRVVGWHLSQHIDAHLVLSALEKALGSRCPAPGFIHHSDRGVEYACRQYVERLLAAGAQISMAAKASPRENAQAESFFRTLKIEEVYLQPGEGYDSFSDALHNLAHFIEEVYNTKRLHSALGYLPPAEYEEQLAAAL